MEQSQDAKLEYRSRNLNLVVSLLVLLALNLGVLMVVAQTRIPLVSIEAEPQQRNLPHPQVLDESLQGNNYRFLSCSGGESVNCHISGNQAGL